MNELTIDGKIFISSKRAAEITGYAKDYVGQLCREGRVTAKLVGRSWYILESSIKDHRYASEEPKDRVTTRKNVTDTWESPKYAVESPVQIPNVAAKPTGAAQQGTVQAMQEAWQEWFSTRSNAVSMPINTTVEAGGVGSAVQDGGEPEVLPATAHEEEEAPEAGVVVPIERIRREHHLEIPVERHAAPQSIVEEPLFIELEEEFEREGAWSAIIKGFSIVIIVAAIVVGILGSGIAGPYLSKYGVLGYTSFITGTTQYTK